MCGGSNTYYGLIAHAVRKMGSCCTLRRAVFLSITRSQIHHQRYFEKKAIRPCTAPYSPTPRSAPIFQLLRDVRLRSPAGVHAALTALAAAAADNYRRNAPRSQYHPPPTWNGEHRENTLLNQIHAVDSGGFWRRRKVVPDLFVDTKLKNDGTPPYLPLLGRNSFSLGHIISKTE